MSCCTDGPAVTQYGQVQPSRKRTMTLPAYVLSETAGPEDHGGPPASVFLVKAGAAWPSCTHAWAGAKEASSPNATATAIVRRIEILPGRVGSCRPAALPARGTDSSP